MTLLDEIRNGENATLEFKEARPKDSLKFTKTVVAFANGRGGRILFGVEDKTGRLVGIPRDKVAAEMDAIADTVANTCTPPLSIDIKPTTIDGKVLIALDVRSGDKTPVFHRDYLEPSSIYVALYDDRLEILSPGGLVKDFSLEDAMNGFSKLRNNALGDALEYMKEVEAWGGGVSRYFTACATAGLPPPIVSEEAGCFKVVFWRQAIANVKTGANESNIGHPNGNIESVKGNIDLQKGNIELPEGDIAVADGNIAMGQNMNVKFSSATLDKIAVLRKSYSRLSFFKRVDALKALKMNPASLSKLFRKMLANGIIETVSGHGKGAYRFASAGGICTDGCRREGGLDE